MHPPLVVGNVFSLGVERVLEKRCLKSASCKRDKKSLPTIPGVNVTKLPSLPGRSCLVTMGTSRDNGTTAIGSTHFIAISIKGIKWVESTVASFVLLGRDFLVDRCIVSTVPNGAN